jgi:hypothetical protein
VSRTERRVEIDRFNEAIDRVRRAFPTLHIDVSGETPHVHALAEVPVQPGLEFTISLYLANCDELHLNAGRHFWVEWFPADRQDVLDKYVGAAIGLLAGDCRIVELTAFGRVVRARLERSTAGDRWVTIATWSNLRGLIPWPTTKNVLHNSRF